MLVELAIGDAYGAGFEFAAAEKVNNYNSVSAYYSHQLGSIPGRYTDDTQMSIALCLMLIEQCDWTEYNIASKFLECFHRDPRVGYSKGFYQFLKSVPTAEDFLNRINPLSTRNGACMRAAPLGVITDIEQMLDYSRLQAKITHNTEIGIASSNAVALCSHFFLKKLGSKSELTEFVSEYSSYHWDDNWSGPVACCGEQTVNALLTVLRQSDSLQSVVRESVAFCGDVDTVAALGLAIASQSDQYRKDLPDFLYNELENGQFGKDYLKKLGNDLLMLNQDCNPQSV